MQIPVHSDDLVEYATACCSVLQCVLQCVAVCCSVLQCVADLETRGPQSANFNA